MFSEMVTVRDTEKEVFRLAMEIMAMNDSNTKDDFTCIGYEVVDNELYLSSYCDDCTLFPYEFNLEQTVEFAWGWYMTNKKPKGNPYNGDGSSEVGFEFTTLNTENVNKYGMCGSIRPIWIYYSK